MNDSPDNNENRLRLVQQVRNEVVGPDPSGDLFEFKEDVTFKDWKDFRTPRKQPNGEECLWQDPPIKRYGAGILFPQKFTEFKQIDEESLLQEEPDTEERGESSSKDDQQKEGPSSNVSDELPEEDHVSLTNCYKPSAMGLSFAADLEQITDSIDVSFICRHMLGSETVDVFPSCYERKKVNIHLADKKEPTSRDIWLRKPIADENGNPLVISFNLEQLNSDRKVLRKWIPGFEDRLEVLAVFRRHPGYDEEGSKKKLITISIVNLQEEQRAKINELCFFQSGLRVSADSENWIMPYSIPNDNEDTDPEVRRNNLLYQKHRPFAVGHGVATNWPEETPSMVGEVWTELLPTFETPSTSADLSDADGNPLRVSMRKLAGLDEGDDGKAEIENLVAAYRSWIEKKEAEIQTNNSGFDIDVAKRNLQSCRRCLSRIENGLEFLYAADSTSNGVLSAFRLTNHAMLIAQLRNNRGVRRVIGTDSPYQFSEPYTELDESVHHETIGYWRAFQIVFLLMTIPDISEGYSTDRLTTDLIWFPTGGGKTEAYLGLSAFTIFFNRITGKKSNTDVLMRYTLRLLTAQQFQRAGLLFCAMDHLRRKTGNSFLGDKPIRLGMWVGRAATPNKRRDATSALSRLQRDSHAENPFVLLKCPWCHAEFGPIRGEGQANRTPEILGYRRRNMPDLGQTVVFSCPDSDCEFGAHPSNQKPLIPITIIDEDIYADPPDMLIGTVDKFALLAWEPQARSIFGINKDGETYTNPPSLIIQDELHLISGPLGSVMGAFETIIEELCTDRSSAKYPVVPKIVASTATISRASDQINQLYARDQSCLFPPPGIDASDSFFSQELRNDSGQLLPGRMYMGIFGSGYSSQQTAQTRIFACLLQWGRLIGNDPETVDPWYTLLAFFNSLRELGSAATLLVSDVRDYLRVILDRHNINYTKIRQLLSVTELTSRIRSDRIPLSIQELEQSCKLDEHGRYSGAIEACLASNIIEVGVDIDRLSLMTIVGQPKTTSQYIQVSSRVGRNVKKPGLVAITYSQSKPRDRSHYEQFRIYHQKLYAQVEPTSVTPFCPPTVDRVLHSLIVSYVRQRAPISAATSPRPFPLVSDGGLVNLIKAMIKNRVKAVDPEEDKYVQRMLEQRLKEWKHWNPDSYGSFGTAPMNPPLMHPAGSTAPDTWQGHSWPTLSSMRDVDATCEAEVTQYYNRIELGDN